MKEVVADSKLVAHCGLYCGACSSCLKGRCPGCHENQKAGWCRVRTCCIEHSFATCADCKEHSDPNACRAFNNFFSRAIGFFLNSDRKACIEKVRALGPEGYAAFMAEHRLQKLPRRGVI